MPAFHIRVSANVDLRRNINDSSNCIPISHMGDLPSQIPAVGDMVSDSEDHDIPSPSVSLPFHSP